MGYHSERSHCLERSVVIVTRLSSAPRASLQQSFAVAVRLEGIRALSQLNMKSAAVAPTVARAQANAQSAKKVRQMVDELQQRIAVMSSNERRRSRERVIQKATSAMTRRRPVNNSQPVRDGASKTL